MWYLEFKIQKNMKNWCNDEKISGYMHTDASKKKASDRVTTNSCVRNMCKQYSQADTLCGTSMENSHVE